MEPATLRPFPMGSGGAGECQQWENRRERSRPCWWMGLQGLVQQHPKPLGSTAWDPQGTALAQRARAAQWGEAGVGILLPKIPTGRSSQGRCLSLQLPLPLGPASPMCQPVWLMSLSILQCHFPHPLPAILGLPRLPWRKGDLGPCTPGVLTSPRPCSQHGLVMLSSLCQEQQLPP